MNLFISFLVWIEDLIETDADDCPQDHEQNFGWVSGKIKKMISLVNCEADESPDCEEDRLHLVCPDGGDTH